MSIMRTHRGDKILRAKFTPGGIGTKDGWIVLCELDLDSGGIDRYVTWWMDEEGHTYMGHYFRGTQLDQAIEDFGERS